MAIEERERAPERVLAAAREHLAVRDDDAVEVPAQDRVARARRRGAVADAEPDDAMRPELARRADQPVKESRLVARAGRQV